MSTKGGAMRVLLVFIAVALIPIKHMVFPEYSDALSIVQLIAVGLSFLVGRE